MSDEATTEPTEPEPKPVDPCPECGRSIRDYLVIDEAMAKFGYGKATCVTCLLTDHKRDNA